MLSFHHFKFGLHGFASRVQVAMVAMADHRTSTAHTIRAKSKSGSTSSRSTVPPSSLGVTIRASALATVGSCWAEKAGQAAAARPAKEARAAKRGRKATWRNGRFLAA
jgi:hypothetical protein